MAHFVLMHSSRLRCELPAQLAYLAPADVSRARISLDMSPLGTHVLVGEGGGLAALVSLRVSENKGDVEQVYSCKESQLKARHDYGAVFATKAQAILMGSIEGCVPVWDKKKGSIVYGLEHEPGKHRTPGD